MPILFMNPAYKVNKSIENNDAAIREHAFRIAEFTKAMTPFLRDF